MNVLLLVAVITLSDNCTDKTHHEIDKPVYEYEVRDASL